MPYDSILLIIRWNLSDFFSGNDDALPPGKTANLLKPLLCGRGIRQSGCIDIPTALAEFLSQLGINARSLVPGDKTIKIYIGNRHVINTVKKKIV